MNLCINYKEKFETQVVDNNFSILSVDSKLEYNNCDKEECDIKFIDKKIDDNNIKSLYYITNNNDIYILNTKIGVKKSKIISHQDLNITAVDFSNNFQYGFVGVKSNSTKKLDIYYTTNYCNTWKKLIINKNSNLNQFKNELKLQYKNDDTLKKKYHNINFVEEKYKIIDNISVVYLKDNTPYSLIFTTFTNRVVNNDDGNKEHYYTETIINKINLIDFKSNEYNNKTYSSKIIKYYYDENINEYSIKLKVKKILNYKREFFILLNTNSNKDHNLLLHIKDDNREHIYTHFALNDIKIININNKTLSENVNDIILALSSDNQHIVTFGLINSENSNGENYKKNLTLENYRFTNDLMSDDILPSYTIQDINSNYINKTNIEHHIKFFDFDFNYIESDTKSIINSFTLYYATIDNKIITREFNLDFYLKEKENFNEINLIDDIDYINNLFIHPKLQKDDEHSLFILNKNKIYFHHNDNWKEINNYNLEYSKYNSAKFINDISDTRKLAFIGDNTLSKHKIYNIEFKIDKYVDILMVGGGGGGGYGGGGGGGGDVKLFKNHKMPAGKYRLLIGSGGQGGKEIDYMSYGNNTEIELIEGNISFNKLVVAGGGGGGSYDKDATRTPINGIIGKKIYSSGGGGGGGGQRGIGSIGNGVSGNGGSSYYNDILYGGGGGSGGNANLFNNNESEYNNGKSPNSKNIGLGGDPIKLIDKYIYNDIKSVSGGGNGGLYGIIDNNNEEILSNKLNMLNTNKILNNYGNYGKGGNGSVIITNLNNYKHNNDIINRYVNGDHLTNNDRLLVDGNEGIIIIYGSMRLNEEIKMDKDNLSNKDKLLNQYKLNERDLKKEMDDYNKDIYDNLKKRYNSKNNIDVKNNKYIIKPYNKDKKNIYELEKESNKIKMEYKKDNDKALIDPVSDSYLPYSQTETKKLDLTDPIHNLNKFRIIKLFKDLLHRQPTSNELNNFSKKIINQTHDLDKIKRHIINTDEYIRVVKLQSNDPNPNLLYAETKKTLFAKIAEIYLTELNEEIPTNLLGPLNDVYHYLQYNEYLLRAILVHSNFENFKDELLENKKLVKNDIIEVLKKYFILTEIKNKANDIQRFDKYNKKDISKNIHEYNNTDKYETITDTNEENQNVPDLKNLILQDNYNYYLWDQKTSEIDTNNFEKKLEEINKMREEIDKLGKETFVNFDISNNENNLKLKNKKNNNDRPELVDKKTYQRMNNNFSNTVNY
tara:strand:- start:1793 stop:5467 length:3675 start_codon:yes stop_codon:yes gene_type:complete